MPRIDQRSQGRPAPDIGSLRDVVWVCTTIERPELGGVSTIVKRPGVIRVHARVKPLKGSEVLNWKAVFDSAQAPTHEITIRTPPDVKVDLNHWVFHQERYAETWFRIRTTEDLGGVRRFLTMLCSIDTIRDRRSDPVTQALPPVWECPVESV